MSPKNKLIADLEEIFRRSMESGKLNVALKAKEIEAKINGLVSSHPSIKPISQWSDEEIESFIAQLTINES